MADAPKRFNNVKKKEGRKAAYARAQARNKRNRERNEARMEANLAELRRLGGTILRKEYTRTVLVKNPKTGIDQIKYVVVNKPESPSEALARTKRQQAGWTGHVPKAATSA